MKKTLIYALLAVMFGLVLFTACEQPAITSAKVYLDNEPEKAIEQCEIALQNNPADPDAHYIMGKAYAKQKMVLKMNDAFTKSLEISQKHAAAIEQERSAKWTSYLNKGVGLYQQGKSSEAAEMFLISTKILPDKAMGHKNLAMAYSDSKQYEQSIASFKTAFELDPMDLDSHYMIGSNYFDAKDYENALTWLSEYLEKADASAAYYNNALYTLAITYDILEQPDKAIDAYKSALTKDPNNKDIKFNMGRLYLKREDWTNALEMFSAVIEIDPTDFYSTMSVGNCYLGLKKWNDAVMYLEKASVLKPDNAEVWFWLGTAYANNDQLEEAKAAFDKNKELSDK